MFLLFPLFKRSHFEYAFDGTKNFIKLVKHRDLIYFPPTLTTHTRLYLPTRICVGYSLLFASTMVSGLDLVISFLFGKEGNRFLIDIAKFNGPI